MKSLPIVLSFLTSRHRRRNLALLGRLLAVFVVLVTVYTILFHLIMEYEGQSHSWITGTYWTLVVMSTLGFGDITFESDLGRAFSIVVLLSGTVFMLVLLPFMFIQFIYVPWMEAQAAARAPKQLPATTKDHVIMTGQSAMEQSLIRLLASSNTPYTVIEPDLDEALRLHDDGIRVMHGDIDDQRTYRRARADQAALLVTARADTTNANIVFTVREHAPQVKIVSTVAFAASIDILQLAGCDRVLQLGEILGQSLARRVLGQDAKSHVIGGFDGLYIAEAAATDTPLVGRTLRDINLPQHAQVSVVGVWDRGHFKTAGPDTLIRDSSILILAGSKQQLATYDGLFCIYKKSDAPVLIIGGGRVGRAAARALADKGMDYRIIEKIPERIRNPEKYILGDAAELEVLHQAGVRDASAVLITTHDDDVNIYLAIYCRRLRPDIQILGRANYERNVSTLHRAGADFVMSYATTGANIIFNMLRRANILLLAEGLDAFRVPIHSKLAGRTLAQTKIRQVTGCHVIAIKREDGMEVTPQADRPLPAHGELILIGDIESQERFLKLYSKDE